MYSSYKYKEMGILYSVTEFPYNLYKVPVLASTFVLSNIVIGYDSCDMWNNQG